MHESSEAEAVDDEELDEVIDGEAEESVNIAAYEPGRLLRTHVGDFGWVSGYQGD